MQSQEKDENPQGNGGEKEHLQLETQPARQLLDKGRPSTFGLRRECAAAGFPPALPPVASISSPGSEPTLLSPIHL